MLDRFSRRKDEENRVRSEGRLPPGQSLTQKFPVLHYGPVPNFNPETWQFRVFGEIEREIFWSWEEFNQLPRSQVTMDIHCVTRWSKFDTRWEGVSVRTLVEQGLIRPRPEARFVLQHAEYGFTANLPLQVVLGDNYLLATHFDGKPIDPDHGYPLRSVVGVITGREDLSSPYFWKGAKWLRGLEFLSTDRPGFWEQAGYHNEADVWEEQRFG
jgi:DMSO/TMAO reductase YedYZ molybdopterin-dependent catalytic subunit